MLRTGPVDDGPVVLYLHGGGYALGSPEVALAITERLSAGCEVISVDYRLAPEHPCPAAIDDALTVHTALVDAASGRSIIVAGDSAGANLALSVALRARDGGGALPAGLVLFSPHVDHGSAPGPGAVDRPSDLDRDAAAWLAAAYRGPLEPDDLRLSPLRADLSGLPPMLVQVGSIDTCLEHGSRLADRARAAGVPVTLEVWRGLWHTWHYHRALPEADRAIAAAVTFARSLPPGST